jgi:hypothetical protein
MAILEKELLAYTQKLPSLIGQQGKYVLIHSEDVIGIYDTYEDALKFGYERFKLDPFLVKQIAPAERLSFFTRDIGISCQV